MDNGISVRALVRLLSTEEGGKSVPVRGSYRPNHNFGGPDNRNMVIGFIDIPPSTELKPGASMEVVITFANSRGLEAEIYPGREWRIQEGAKLVGFGTVIDVLS